MLTQFTVKCVVFGQDRLRIANVPSTNKPVDIGVPAVHKATKMIFFKVTFCNCRHHQLSAHISLQKLEEKLLLSTGIVLHMAVQITLVFIKLDGTINSL